MKVLLKKELATFLRKPSFFIVFAVAYLFLAVNYFTQLSQFSKFSQQLYQNGGLSFVEAMWRPFISSINMLLFFLVPLWVSSSFSSEYRNNTISLLFSSKLSSRKIVFSKFIANAIIIISFVSLVFLLAVCTSFWADFSLLELLGPYLSVCLLSLFYVALTSYFSSMTASTWLSGGMSLLSSLFMWSIPNFTWDASAGFYNVSQFLWLGGHLSKFSNSNINLLSICYILSLVFFFQFLTVQNLENKKRGL